jgi:hypothetical protein
MMDFGKGGARGLVLASMLVAAAALCSPGTAYAQNFPGQPNPGQPNPGQPHPGQPYPGQAHTDYHHHGGDGIGPGAAVGIGLGAAAVGAALGAGAYGYPYGYAPAPTYYAAPVYPYPRSCWYPQYQGYFAC